MSQNRVIENVFFPGHEVEFTYTHWLNSKSSTKITRRGKLFRQVRQKQGTHLPTGYWMIKFPGNKGLTKVHESRLVKLILNPNERKEINESARKES